MKKADLFIISVAFVLLPNILYAQAPDTLWTRRYKGPADSIDGATACVIDTSDNLYVTGFSYNGTNDKDYLTIKYNAAGDTLWTRWYNGPADSNDCAAGCKVDAIGNIYVTGYSFNGTNYDYLTIKYNPAGDTLWTRRYNGPANGGDYAFSCTVDDSDNLYVTGYSNNGTNSDYLTIKYNTAGDTLWTCRYNGPTNSSDYAMACAVDSHGNVYVTGYTLNGTYFDYLTIKYNIAGDTLWSRMYNGLANKNDKAFGCVVDNLGYLYVTGLTYLELDYDCLTIKYNAAGDTLWTRQYNGPTNNPDLGRSCAVDDSGNIYVIGASSDGRYHYLVIKYNATGDTLWTCQYKGPAYNSDDAYGCAVDGSGNLYVTGWSDSLGNFDYLTIKYNTTTGVAGKPDFPITDSKLRLEQNKPNPFSQHTTISYQLSTSGPANLKIYNAAGQLVKTFDMGQQQAGHHQVEWSDSKIPAGVYFYRLTAGNYQATKKLVVLK